MPMPRRAVCSAALAVLRRSAVAAVRKERRDGEEVVREVSRTVRHFPAGVNHEARPSGPEDTLDEVEAESRESIAMRNDDHPDLTLDDCLQKGTQPRALEVDARRDVFDHFESRVGGLEGEDLAMQVSARLGRADAGVNDLAPRGSGLVFVANAKALANIVGVVEALPSIAEPQRFDVPVSVPFAERAQRHAVASCELGAR